MIHLIDTAFNVNNQKYYFGSITNILNYFTDEDTQFTEDNYRLNNNILKIGFTSDFPQGKAIQKHTVIEILGFYKRVYNVISYVIQSNYIYYTLEIDLWHTFIYDAQVKNLRVLRSTRNIKKDNKSLGFYKTPLQAMKEQSFIPLALTGGAAEHAEIDAHNFSLVMAIKYNLFQAQTGSMSTTKLFALNIGDLLEQYCTSVTTAGNANAVNRCVQDVIMDILSGLYEMQNTITTSGGTQQTYTVKAELKNAWIIDNGIIMSIGQEQGMYTDLRLKIRSKHVGWEDVTIRPNWVVCSDGRNIQGNGYTVPARVRKLSFNNTKPNCKYLIGTPHANMEVNALYGGIEAEIRCTVDVDNLNVILIQGDQEIDITSAFSLNYTAVDGDITYDRYILDAIQNALPLISSWGGLANNALTGNTFGAISSAANVFGHATSLMLNSPQFAQRMGYNVKAGSAGMVFFANYYRMAANLGLLTNPYCIVEIEDEKTALDELQYYGLVYDCTIAEFYMIFTYNDATTNSTTVGTIDGFDYLQCKDITFYGDIPKQAQEYIYNKLIGGIRIKDISQFINT